MQRLERRWALGLMSLPILGRLPLLMLVVLVLILFLLLMGHT